VSPPIHKAALAAVFTAMYAAIGLFRHWRFDSSAYDLGIFDQIVWHYSRFETPASSITGAPNILGDHFSPIWALAAPFYWLYSGPETLILLQSALFGASVVPVWMFLERRLPRRPALLLSIAYGLFFGLQRAAQFDVHEVAFAPLFIGIMLLGLDNVERGRRIWPTFLAGAIPLCFVKEDQAPLVAAAAALVVLRAKDWHTRRVAGGVAVLALAFFAVIVGWLIPSMSRHGAFQYGSAYAGTLSNPVAAITALFLPVLKLRTLASTFLAFLLLPLASPYALLTVPLFVMRFLSASSNHWGTIFHYSAPLAPILAMAAGDGLARIARRFALSPRALTTIASVSIVFSAILPGHQPAWKLFVPDTYRAPVFAPVATRALAIIPPDASVVAQSAIVPHLSTRATIYMLRGEGPGAGADADYVIAAPDDVGQWPFDNGIAVRGMLGVYEKRGYTTRFDERGWIVLAKPGAPAPAR
jgi:uncharacterized membrane protein